MASSLSSANSKVITYNRPLLCLSLTMSIEPSKLIFYFLYFIKDSSGDFAIQKKSTSSKGHYPGSLEQRNTLPYCPEQKILLVSHIINTDT